MALHSSDKWRFTLYTVVIVILVFNHFTFKIVNSILGKLIGPLCDKNGSPNMKGFIVHLIVFALLLRLSMEIR
jgi:hypothetical protein